MIGSFVWNGANRLTTFTASNGVTTTLDYDSLGRITRRYTALGYSDYVYEDGTNWLVRETWHSAISGNAFDRVRYRYANGRPDYVEIAQTPGDLSEVWSYDQRYLQANWHGDLMRRVWLNGDGATEMAYDPWGNSVRGLHYYEWNGAWGYMAFGALQLYYVHGRWYNPDTGLWLSPDEQGEYRYGSGQNAVDWAWMYLRGTGCEFVDAELVGALSSGEAIRALLNGPRGAFYEHCLSHFDDPGYEQGVWTGRQLSTLASMLEIAYFGPSAGAALVAAGPSGGLTSVAGAAALVPVAHGGTVALRNTWNQYLAIAKTAKSNGDPTLSYGTNTGDTGSNATRLRQNMGVGDTPGKAAHHIVPSTHSYDAARDARRILQRLGIDINAAENGVLLRQEIHNGLANNQRYMRAVLSELESATTRQDAVGILRDIGQRLLSGTFPR
jgi:YD repeat-containing protein